MEEINEIFENIILIPCSGSEYHGELARQVAIRIAERSKISPLASMMCSTIFLKNILLGKENMVEITKNHLKNSYLILINGCDIACMSQIYNYLGIKPDLIISVQDIIPKQHMNLKNLEAFKKSPKLSEIKEKDIFKVSSHIIEGLKKHGIIMRE